MQIACCVWALKTPEDRMLSQIHDLGFEWIDVQPALLRSGENRNLATQLGLRVSCLGASFDMPAGAALDHGLANARRLAIEHVAEALDHAEDLGATIVYVIPGADASPAALQRYQDSVCELADTASAKNIKLAVEHFPGTALPTASATLSFIRNSRNSNLYLIYDSGHIQMTGEDPASVISDAGDRLAYVHFDDNDGKGDLHWALFDGVMTEHSLAETIRALEGIQYGGAVSLELSPELADPLDALARSRVILTRALRD